MIPRCPRSPRSRRRAVVLVSAALLLGACQPSTQTTPLAGGTTVRTVSYAIAQRNADRSPVRWNPCAPIHYVVSFTHAPSFALAEITRAVQAMESASGLDFVYDGATSERPPRTGTTLPDGRPRPVLISFATATEVPFGAPLASGWGQAITTTDPQTGERRYVTGQVVLRPGGWTEGTSSANPLSLMLRHELGHVVGLAHVSARTEIMGTGGNGSARRWGPGDLAGLAAVGRPAGCL